ncbi:hypothetical protein Emtol_2644 [Emticicia oligotrophica DSM 17448]|uniref:DUF4843 domain-containing protein n=1 Tax=Emticicia oligotrophica (strain DSM 17448 / CIP 109782 / MTCC 6937 / GPTSA100-15) TaxID=929562 RepID=A0ABN4ANP1_EMTOG|nr:MULTISPECIES: DUF4843 domain-containing protein [Emticicia]AFK03780.1 hypothetical protein Emtol_2644 [Emticicia oligotrophica DSM 17448]
MKKILGIALVMMSTIIMSSCFKDNQPVFDSMYLVEFQDAVVTAPALNKTFPIIAVANGAGVQTRRINLVGRQRENEESIKFSVDPNETTAKEGVHYTLEGGSVKIPAKSSFGDCKINILKAPAAAGTSVVLVLVLEGNGSDIKPNENYKKLGFRINL